MTPTVSVIIPNYNHVSYLQQRIETVINQTYKDFEVIILDDFSTDDSKSVIESYRFNPNVVHIEYNEVNSGSPFNQWAKGISIARGEYIWIAESDDFCELTFLEKLLECHKKHENIGIAYCKSLPIDINGRVYDRSDGWMRRVDSLKWESDYVNSGKNECERYLSVQCTVPNASAVLFKTSVFNNLDVAKIDFKVCGDWQIYVQILKTTNICYCASPLNYHRNHPQNARSKYSNITLEEQFKVLRFIAENYSIKKTYVFRKSIEERISMLIFMIKTRRLSNEKLRAILRNAYVVDHWILARLVKVFLFKFLQIYKGFE